MRYAYFLALSLLLSSCAAFQDTPKAPPAPTSQAQEISRDQSNGLPKIGNISVNVRGSPDDAEREIAAQANRAGATYYQIVMLSETVMPGLWYSTAILYGASTATGTQK